MCRDGLYQAKDRGGADGEEGVIGHLRDNYNRVATQHREEDPEMEMATQDVYPVVCAYGPALCLM